MRWATFLKLIMCYLGLGRPEEALGLAEEAAAGKTSRPEWRCQLSYLLAMLHARYLPARDLAKAEAYLEEGLKAIEGGGFPEDRVNFQYAFNRNGLAMVRHFQGRFEEAIALCRLSHAHLEEHLAVDKHRLHRSVLLYNLAQVFTVLGEPAEAISHLNAAIEMDPNYSEYYNDRGNIYLNLRRPAEACRDYIKAIELSPPYPEVFTNLGQCFRMMGRFEEALAAYSTALDLDPGRVLPWIGRGQCHEAQESWVQAIQDYTAAIEIDKKQWDAFALRAIARYAVGEPSTAVADLDRAIGLAPENADLYQNRAIALADLGRALESKCDLETYLRLRPNAEDRAEVEARLREFFPLVAGHEDEVVTASQ
jgi:tetratricopeptide (TPR) repeat protein